MQLTMAILINQKDNLCNYENHHVMICIGNKVNATYIPDNFDHVWFIVNRNVSKISKYHTNTFHTNLFWYFKISQKGYENSGS